MGALVIVDIHPRRRGALHRPRNRSRTGHAWERCGRGLWSLSVPSWRTRPRCGRSDRCRWRPRHGDGAPELRGGQTKSPPPVRIRLSSESLELRIGVQGQLLGNGSAERLDRRRPRAPVLARQGGGFEGFDRGFDAETEVVRTRCPATLAVTCRGGELGRVHLPDGEGLPGRRDRRARLVRARVAGSLCLRVGRTRLRPAGRRLHGEERPRRGPFHTLQARFRRHHFYDGEVVGLCASWVGSISRAIMEPWWCRVVETCLYCAEGKLALPRYCGRSQDQGRRRRNSSPNCVLWRLAVLYVWC